MFNGITVFSFICATKQLISNTVTKIFSESYLLKAPLSPNIAAKQEGIKIDLDNIVLPKKINEVENKYLIIEGAGGLLVPINNQHFVIDIAKKFNCEIVLVINEYLGCINHALLSINYLQQHQYKIHVIVFNGSFNTEVKQSILNFCKGIKTIDIPQIEPLTKESILQNTISYLEFK